MTSITGQCLQLEHLPIFRQTTSFVKFATLKSFTVACINKINRIYTARVLIRYRYIHNCYISKQSVYRKQKIISTIRKNKKLLSNSIFVRDNRYFNICYIIPTAHYRRYTRVNNRSNSTSLSVVRSYNLFVPTIYIHKRIYYNNAVRKRKKLPMFLYIFI